MRRKSVIGALLLTGVGVLLGGTVLRDQVASAGSLAQSVLINNTPSQAVPVREQNLDGSNLRVHEEGTANVTFADNPARHPFRMELSDLSGGQESFQVPSGHRLVIQELQGVVSVTGDQRSNDSTFNLLSGSLLYRFSVTGREYDGLHTGYSYTDATTIYFDGGATVQGAAFAPAGSDIDSWRMEITGYLVSTP